MSKRHFLEFEQPIAELETKIDELRYVQDHYRSFWFFDAKVWVGEAAWDPVVHTAFFGVDPGSDEFGARTMSVAGGVDPETGEILTASVGHDWYLEPGTESLRNLSLIGIDRGDLVTDGTEPGTMLAAEH